MKLGSLHYNTRKMECFKFKFFLSKIFMKGFCSLLGNMEQKENGYIRVGFNERIGGAVMIRKYCPDEFPITLKFTCNWRHIN